MRRYFPLQPPDTDTNGRMLVTCTHCNSRQINLEKLEFSAVQDLVLRFRCEQGHTFVFRLVGGNGTDMCLYPLEQEG